MDTTQSETTAPSRPGTPTWFWVIAILATLWHIMGLWGFVSFQLFTEEFLDALTEAQAAIFANLPTWYIALWALSTITAFLGSLALLLRKALALWLFIIALGAFLITCIYSFGVLGSAEVMGTADIAFSAAIGVVMAGLIWLSHWGRGRGILT